MDSILEGLTGLRIPPFTAVNGLACFRCYKESSGPPLLRCSKCWSVRYCGSVCQKLDWKQHKAICNALYKLQMDPAFRSTHLRSFADKPTTDLQRLNMAIDKAVVSEMDYLKRALQRNLTPAEQMLLGDEAHCMGCGRSDRILRMQTLAKNDGSPIAVLKRCETCHLSYYCCDSHWQAVKKLHSGQPCEDGHDGLSQCGINQEILIDHAFSEFIQRTKAGAFVWAPQKPHTKWTSLKGKTWKTEFGADLANQFKVSGDKLGAWIRAASDGLSMPMSILWSLETLNGSNDSWTRQETLDIHILGSYENEVVGVVWFEEILHRLPEVKHLKLVLCGPELDQFSREKGFKGEADLDVCRDCRKKGRKMSRRLFAQTYHDVILTQRGTYTVPDLAIAFNAGTSKQSQHTWIPTMAALVKGKIPTVFTAFDEDEAGTDVNMWPMFGAKLIPALGPSKNPWGSEMLKRAPHAVSRYYAGSLWFSGGFR
ncbi:hypothetical protein Hypma_000529 [Hypsizygus marmoreus]|uniref:MYND-type domain-containing protein n=1 Tax=Hypsizygus marmoreus TaxID=39966 RepID=A0A369JFJ8_HYPMA|nr:hypothetical protein Hypma_000529 [Hypsizygus marmoreus]